jgi:hypothetical protein
MTELANAPRETDVSTPVRRRRRWPWLAAIAAAAVIGFVLYWFQPQKLFIDDRVDEDVPVAVLEAPTDSVSEPAAHDDAAGSAGADAPAPEPTTTPTTLAPAEPVEVARGDFVSLDHGTSGVVRALELADGRRFVRLEGLDTSNGPDLFVYLSTNTATGEEGAFDDDYFDLGRLKGNQGDQNYELPAEVDLSRFASVVIWCDRFDSAFGAADI